MTEPSSARAYQRTFKNALRERGARRAAAIIANSEGGAALWRNRVSDGRCHVVHNGLPLAEIEASTPDSRSAGAVPLVLYVGRFDAAKNLETLVHGLARVTATLDVRALLCGDGPQHSQIRELCRSLGLGSRVQAPGPISTPWALMKSATAFVSVSFFEGQPNAVLEAMACGAPLVVSDIPSHREFLDESCAVFVDGRDPEAIAAGLRDVLNDPQRARWRALQAKARAAGFSIPAMADGHERVYRAVLGLSDPLGCDAMAGVGA